LPTCSLAKMIYVTERGRCERTQPLMTSKEV
jgi:hypothetical protein